MPMMMRRRVRVRADDERRGLYELSPVTDSGSLDVGDGHSVYYEVRGTVQNAPMALFLHGGPGAGCFPNHARFFDPKKWRACVYVCVCVCVCAYVLCVVCCVLCVDGIRSDQAYRQTYRHTGIQTLQTYIRTRINIPPGHSY